MQRAALGDSRNSFPVDEASLSHFGIKRAVEFIHEHHPATLDLEQAATEACLSKYHFSRLFHRTVGMPYQDYLTRIRIEEAKGAPEADSLSVVYENRRQGRTWELTELRRPV